MNLPSNERLAILIYAVAKIGPGTRVTENRIMNIVKEAKAETMVEALSRQHGFRKAILYR